MHVSELNALPRSEAVALLAPLVAVPSWAEALVDARPFADADDAIAAGRRLAEDWGEADVRAALAGHPRLGERPTGDDAGAAMSRAEQARLAEDADDADLAARLAAGNAAYEARFGHVYLVRAKGRDAEELLAILERRLGHDPALERRIVHEQLVEITLLRLADLLGADLLRADAEVPA